MKRIYLIWVILCALIPNLVFADGIQVNVVGNEGIKQLEYLVDGKQISFNEAKSKFGVNDFYSALTSEGEFYFFQGKQISYDEYTLGLDNRDADERTKLYGEYGIRVHNTKEIIDNINNLYTKRLGGEYHFIYSKKEYASIDFNQINALVTDNYLIDKNTNIFKYSEYGIFNYPRFLYESSEVELIVNVNPIISLDEEEKLNEFMNVFKNEFVGKSDYDKILIVYSYLNHTILKNSDCTSNISAYNALIDRDAGCIGKSNAFSYIMDYLGIESYIANNAVYKDDSVVSTHTFNVVKLNEKYYIVDLMLDGYNGLLKTNDENIVFSNGITISDQPYANNNLNVSIDYNKYDLLVNKIKDEVKQQESLDKKDKELKSVDFVSYLILIIILLIVTIIILIFTRKK